jgi:hypothetical protein
MSGTHFPNGISVQEKSATNASAGAGDLDCVDLYVSGDVNGQDAIVQYTFGSASTSEVTYIPAPFDGDITDAFVTVVTSARVAAYTVRQGSAGTVSISSEGNTTGVSGSISSLTIDSASITTASALQFTRGVQGTTGVTTLSLVIKRT